MVILSKRALFVFSEKLATVRQGPAGEKGRLHINHAGTLKKGAGIKPPMGRRKSGALFHLEGNAMAKSIGTIHSWREIPIPYRCEGCPYPKVGFVCYGKDGSCLRSDVQEIEARQASKSTG